jgi:uncharacterized protein (TIGR02996 family)
MTKDEAFRRAILDDPDDDTPRLVYADWLEENGDPERAELIRAQCRAAQIEDVCAEQIDLEERARQLLFLHGKRWRVMAPLLIGGSLEFGRGFPEKLRATVPNWRASSGEAAAVLLREVEIYGSSGAPEEWRRLPLVYQIRKLQFTLSDAGRVATFLRHNDLRGLVSLDLGRTRAEPAVVEALLAPGAFPQLTTLRWDVGRAADLVGRLADTTHLPRLRGLDLRGSLLEDAAWGRFVSGRLLTQLARLWLSYTRVDNARLKALLESPRLGALRLLHLERSALTNDAALLLAACERLADLRSLDLSLTAIRQRGMAALARSGRLANLRELSLNKVKLDEKSVQQIAASPRWGGLVSLSLNRAGLTDAGLQTLAAGGRFPHLRKLSLEHNPKISSAGMKALADAPQLANLRWLLLQGTKVDAAGIRTLGESPYLGSLTRLSLSTHSLTKGAASVLAESPVFRHLYQR